jgi:hypothetical protein
MGAEVEALKAALARALAECGRARTAGAMATLSRLVFVALKHTAQVKAFFQAHMADDRAFLWVNRGLQVLKALEEQHPALQAVQGGWVRVGPDAEGDVWYENAAGQASWVIPIGSSL